MQGSEGFGDLVDVLALDLPRKGPEKVLAPLGLGALAVLPRARSGQLEMFRYTEYNIQYIVLSIR